MSEIAPPTSPRERARRDASIGALHLMRLLMVVGLVECVAVVIDLALDPEPVPELVAHLGNGLRAALALAAFLVGRKLQGWANVLGFGLWLGVARGFAVVSLIFGVVRALGLQAPAGVPDEVWPGLLATFAHVGTVGALALSVFVVSRFAAEADLIGAGRHLAWATVPLIASLVAGMGFVEPALLPVWWTGGALALATPWVLCVARVLDWARALLPTLFLSTALLLLTMFEGPTTVIAGLAAVALIIISAAFPRAPLAALNMLLGEEAAAAPSRTFIRRLLDGPIDAEASRLGSQAEASNAEESLALAYRELGIEPRVKANPATQGEAAPLGPLEPMAKLEPISRRVPLVVVPPPPEPTVHVDPRERAQWATAERGMWAFFVGFILRSVVFVAAILLSRSPILRNPYGFSIAVGVFALCGALAVYGLWRMRAMPARARARSTLTVALVAGVLMVAIDIAVIIAIETEPMEAVRLAVLGTGAWLTMMFAAIVGLAQVFRDLDWTVRRSRILTPSLLLSAYAVFGGIAAYAAAQPEILSTLVAVPAAVAASVLGTIFFILMLWLINDARTAIIDWQTRVDRAATPSDEPPAAA